MHYWYLATKCESPFLLHVYFIQLDPSTKKLLGCIYVTITTARLASMIDPQTIVLVKEGLESLVLTMHNIEFLGFANSTYSFVSPIKVSSLAPYRALCSMAQAGTSLVACWDGGNQFRVGSLWGWLTLDFSQLVTLWMGLSSNGFLLDQRS